jgi:predicted glycoside hydrolase/deacetylase ChbG (UPF0249 family)
LTIEAFERLIGSLSDGTTELGCHPAADADLDSTYARERPIELEVLCSGRARHAIESTGVELISFHAASAVTT